MAGLGSDASRPWRRRGRRVDRQLPEPVGHRTGRQMAALLLQSSAPAALLRPAPDDGAAAQLDRLPGLEATYVLRFDRREFAAPVALEIGEILRHPVRPVV